MNAALAVSAVVAVGEIAEPLIGLLKQKAANIKIGPGDQPGVDMGPLVTGERRSTPAAKR